MLLLLAGSSPMNIMQMEKEAKAEQVANREGEKGRNQPSPGLGPGSAILRCHHLTLADCLDPVEN